MEHQTVNCLSRATCNVQEPSIGNPVRPSKLAGMKRCLAILLLVVWAAWAQVGLGAYMDQTDARLRSADLDSVRWVQRMQAAPGDPVTGSLCSEQLAKIWSVAVADVHKISAPPEASAYKTTLDKLMNARYECFSNMHFSMNKVVEYQRKVADLKARRMSDEGIEQNTRLDKELLLKGQKDLTDQEALVSKLAQELATERLRLGR